jgi:hypothetical protein
MKRKLAVAVLLCAMVVTVLALAVAPAASAKAVFTTDTGTEVYAAAPNLVSESITGKVAHLTFDNTLREVSDSGSPLGTGYMFTHMNVVTFPVDGSWMLATKGICYGSFQLVLDNDVGVWEGVFTGTISMADGTYDVTASGRGVSGDVAGMVLKARSVNTDGYASAAIVTSTVIDPHGL